MGPQIHPHPSPLYPVSFMPRHDASRRVTADPVVHEISGVVPDDTINSLLAVVGIDDNGVNSTLTKGGFEAVRSAVKSIGREGWSAGQVLEQVSQRAVTDVMMLICLAARCADTNGYDTSYAQGVRSFGDRRV